MAKAPRAPTTMAQRVGDRIRFFRKSHSLTQAELAERSDVDDITISRLETGARAPSIDQLERLASVFEVPISQLLNETEVPSSERGKMLASMLGSLSNEQQAFVVELVRLYVEAHGKKSRPR